NLVGDVDAGRDRRADGEETGMVEGPVPEILEDMRRAYEPRPADPVRALAAHLGERQRVFRVVEGGKPMAADARPRQAARGKPGRGVVRTARAKPRDPPL